MFEFDDAPRGLARLIYASRSAQPAPAGFAEQVRAILLKSIHNNRMADLTGFLVAGEGRFLQVLEGPAAEVEATFARISKDPRHTDVTVIAQGVAEKRLFRDWNMAQHQVGLGDRDLLARVGLAAFTPEILDEAGALKVLSTLGGRHRR